MEEQRACTEDAVLLQNLHEQGVHDLQYARQCLKKSYWRIAIFLFCCAGVLITLQPDNIDGAGPGPGAT